MMQLMKTVTMLHFYKAKVLRVIDADTFLVLIDKGFHNFFETRIRLLECDAPEMRGHEKEMGKRVTEKTKEMLALYDNDIFIQTVKTDSFGRWLSYAWIDQECKGNINDQVERWSEKEFKDNKS